MSTKNIGSNFPTPKTAKPLDELFQTTAPPELALGPYVIMINEEQRQALLTLCKRECPDDDHPLCFWVEMLEGLPIDETGECSADGAPMIHGFCL
jgi:hypothetical protein